MGHRIGSLRFCLLPQVLSLKLKSDPALTVLVFNSNFQYSSAPIQTGETTITTTTMTTSAGGSVLGHSDESPEKRKFSRRNWFAWKLEVFWQIATALRLQSKKK